MSSFKVKLFVYFLLMAVVPIGAAAWSVSALQGRTQTRIADARLDVELRAALAAYRARLAAASAAARRRARSPAVVRALGAGKEGAGRGGHAPAEATQRITIVGRHGPIGSIRMAFPLDRSLVRWMERRTGIPADDHIAILRHGRVVAADAALRGRLPQSARTLVAELAGHRYRVRVAQLPQTHGSALALLARANGVEPASGAATRRLVVALLMTLVLAAFVAYFEGRAIVQTIRSLVAAAHQIARGRLDERVAVRGRDELASLGRAFNTMAEQLSARLEEVEAERARVRDIVSGFGAALAATHDVDELLRVIVETAVEATGASGAMFVGSEDALVGCGDFDDDGECVELVLEGPDARFGILTLVGREFRRQDLETASSLVTQAVVALENARLHRIVARQALTDGLTGLANRRQCDQALATEIARVRRFGGSLAVVVADLDDFKRLNDTYGHATGDVVLREFAEILRASLRASDLAGRWGGEEFVLLLRDTGPEGGVELAERVRSALESRTFLSAEGAPVDVTASFGVSTLDADDLDVNVVAAADAALYLAKRGGKNRVFPTRTSDSRLLSEGNSRKRPLALVRDRPAQGGLE